MEIFLANKWCESRVDVVGNTGIIMVSTALLYGLHALAVARQ
jgi:hypothetical protein